jgi:hypothetical protein
MSYKPKALCTRYLYTFIKWKLLLLTLLYTLDCCSSKCLLMSVETLEAGQDTSCWQTHAWPRHSLHMEEVSPTTSPLASCPGNSVALCVIENWSLIYTGHCLYCKVSLTIHSNPIFSKEKMPHMNFSYFYSECSLIFFHFHNHFK